MKQISIALMIIPVMATIVMADDKSSTIRAINSLIVSLRKQRESSLVTMEALKTIALNLDDANKKIHVYREILGFVLDKYVINRKVDVIDPVQDKEERSSNFHYYKRDDSSNKLLTGLKKLMKSKQHKEKEFVLKHNSDEELNAKKKKNKVELDMLDQIYNHLEKVASEVKSKDEGSRKVEPK